jgi:hypothetical protein
MGRILVPVPCRAESVAVVLAGLLEVAPRDRSVGRPLRFPSHRGAEQALDPLTKVSYEIITRIS